MKNPIANQIRSFCARALLACMTVCSGVGAESFELEFSSQDQSVDDFIRPYIHHAGLLGGTNMHCLIDTGYNTDGRVGTGDIRELLVKRVTRFVLPFRDLRVPECEWEGQTFNRLIVGRSMNANILGLRFLARHLVTLDFPSKRRYLRLRTTEPLTAAQRRSSAKLASAEER